MTDAQTEARAIAQKLQDVVDGTDGWLNIDKATDIIATALTAKDAELAAERAALHLAADRADRAEAQLAEANKALVIANAQLDNMEFLSVEGFMDWQQEYRAARRAREQGGENG